MLPNGIRGGRRAGAGRRIRDELGLGSDPVVLLGGPLRAEKGHDRAFAAIEILHRRIPRLRALVLGDGPQAHDVMRRASELNGEVTALGYRADVMAVSKLLGSTFFDPRPTNTTIICGFPVEEIKVELEMVALRRR